jgi:hypothetical protein
LFIPGSPVVYVDPLQNTQAAASQPVLNLPRGATVPPRPRDSPGLFFALRSRKVGEI